MAFPKDKDDYCGKKQQFEEKEPLRNCKKSIFKTYVAYIAQKGCLDEVVENAVGEEVEGRYGKGNNEP